MRGRDHRRSREYLAFEPRGKACWRCGAPASTRDHVPALALHHHHEGAGCCELRPACARCNARDGQAITAELNRRRAARRRRRYGLLAEGDGAA